MQATIRLIVVLVATVQVSADRHTDLASDTSDIATVEVSKHLHHGMREAGKSHLSSADGKQSIAATGSQTVNASEAHANAAAAQANLVDIHMFGNGAMGRERRKNTFAISNLEMHGSKQSGTRMEGSTRAPAAAPAASPADNNEKPEATEEAQEKKLEKEESSLVIPSLNNMAQAVSDPRGFLLQQPPMQIFVTGLKQAIDMGPNKGYCLTDGSEFDGYGCAEAKGPQICKCLGLLESCWVPTDSTRIVKSLGTGDPKAALEEAKELLFGACYTPRWLQIAVPCVLIFLVLCCVFVGYRFVKKKRQQTNGKA